MFRFRFLIFSLCFLSFSTHLLGMQDEINQQRRAGIPIHLDQIPEDISSNILVYLNQRNICPVMRVNKHFNRLMSDNKLWYRYAQRACTSVEAEYAPTRDYKALIRQHCTPSFTLLESKHNVYPTGVSADGSVIVGLVNLNSPEVGERAFRWTETEGINFLLPLQEDYYDNNAQGISANGLLILGNKALNGFRWTQAKEEPSLIEDLPLNPDFANSHLNRLSADGSVAVGYVDDGTHDQRASRRAAQWIRNNTTWETVCTLIGETNGCAQGVNADGSIIVGFAKDDSAGNQIRAFRYAQAEGATEEERIKFLGCLANGTESQAYDVSADGSVIVGYSGDANGTQTAFRYTQEEEMQPLSFQGGANVAGIACGVNANGSRIVGSIKINNNQQMAFLWTPKEEIQTVEKLLRDKGVFSSEWTLSEANAISPDGTVLVGIATSTDPSLDKQQGWRAVIPKYDLF